MATVSISGFIYATTAGSGAIEYEFFRSDDMHLAGRWTLVGPHTITIELPAGFDPAGGRAAMLQRQRAAALDQAAALARELEQLAGVPRLDGG